MSGGSKSSGQVKPPKEFKGAFKELGYAAEDLAQQAFDQKYYVPGFTMDQRSAKSVLRGLGNADPLQNEAAGVFRNNAGISALKGININDERRQALQALQGFNSSNLQGYSPQALQGVDFGALEGYDSSALRGLTFDQLQETAGGQFLDVGNNPFLADALSNAQRQTTDRFTQDVQPALAAQFGGGFGLTGSASINAQRRAAEDLSRALSEQATATYADQFNRERAFQEAARSQLAGLQLNQAGQIDQNMLSRAGQLGQLDLSRAGQIDELGLSRAGQIDANALARAGQLGQLGLGFTQAGIDRGAQIGNLDLQRAQGLAGIGAQKQQQALQRANALFNLGEAERSLLERKTNAPLDERLRRLGQVGNIVGVAQPYGAPGGGGGSALSGALGGALTGGSLGSAFGPLGGVIGAGIGGLGGVFL